MNSSTIRKAMVTLETLGVERFARWAASQTELAAIIEIVDDPRGLAVRWADPDGRTGVMAVTIYEPYQGMNRAGKAMRYSDDGKAYRLQVDRRKHARRKLAGVLKRWLVDAKNDKKTTVAKDSRKKSEIARDIYSMVSKAKKQGRKLSFAQAISDYQEEHPYMPFSESSVRKQLTELRKESQSRARKRQ